MAEISIIVPVYKAQNYISRCIDSILGQEFSDFELILIDDGSPDESGKICDEYALKDNRIKVIHQDNKGASAARNRGIDEASGIYIMFCDSDDIVSTKWAKRLYESIAGTNNYAVCGYVDDSSKLGRKSFKNISSDNVMKNWEYFEFFKAGISGFLWNGIFSTDIIRENNLRLRVAAKNGDYNEDLIFTLQYVAKTENIVYTGFSDYVYCYHSDSMSHSFDRFYFDKYKEKFNLWKSFIEEYCKDKEIQHKKYLSTKMLYHFLISLEMNHKRGYTEFCKVAGCDEMRECLIFADTSKENQTIIKLLRNKRVFILYLVYTFQNFKKRLTS